MLSPGAIMISFFLERTRMKVRSFWGSMSRMVLLAFITSWWISPAYCTVLELSRVDLMGIPEGKTFMRWTFTRGPSNHIIPYFTGSLLLKLKRDSKIDLNYSKKKNLIKNRTKKENTFVFGNILSCQVTGKVFKFIIWWDSSFIMYQGKCKCGKLKEQGWIKTSRQKQTHHQ